MRKENKRGMMDLSFDTKWQARFARLAKEISNWSKDPSTRVGAVIVRPDKTICSIGFNGFPRGVSDSSRAITNRDIKLFRTIHAELNAILSAKEPLMGYSMFVWPVQPCAHCAAAIIQSGIKQVYFPEWVTPIERWKESFSEALQMFDESGVTTFFS